MKSLPEFREFFAELAKNSPACGIFQVRSEQKVFDAVTRVVSGSMDLFKSSNHAYLIALQTTVPILVNFVLVRETTEGDHQMKSVIFYSTSWKLVRHPFKAVHLVPVTMLLLSIAC